MQYPDRAIRKCAVLYARGLSEPLIEDEMRREWPDWTSGILHGPNGWINLHEFDAERERFSAEMKTCELSAEQTANEMLTELVQIRRDLFNEMQLDGQTTDIKRIDAYTKITRAIEQLLKADESSKPEPLSIEHNELFLILMEIPEVKRAIEAHKEEILQKIERAV